MQAWAAGLEALGWYIDVYSWSAGGGCALARGINENEIRRTAKLRWNGDKTDLVVVYDVPDLVAGEDNKAEVVTLDDDTTAIDFRTARQLRLTVTANRTLTVSGVPADDRDRTLYILTSGTSSFTITFGGGFRSTATLATGTTNNRVFAVTFRSDGTTLTELTRTAAMVP